MKKILLTIVLLLVPTFAMATNHIYDIDMDIYLDENGNAKVTEVWDVKGSDGTEWYKCMYNLGNSEISNYKVSMDGQELMKKTWDVDESLSEKKGYYGINYASGGQELCFGKYDYKRHKFTLTYNLSNFVFNTSDSQIIYFKFIDKLSNVDFDNFKVTVSSFYSFPDSLDVWGYGNKGYAYVKNGKIEMSNEENSSMNDKYVVLLAKFPLNTFTTSNSSYYKDFDAVYNKAQEGTFKYDYGNTDTKSNNGNWSIFDALYEAFVVLIRLLPIAIVIVVAAFTSKNNRHGYKNNKQIDKKNVPMFRDIPCNKDIYYANALISLNNFDCKDTNILGAIILKWVKNDKVKFVNVTSGIFNKETSALDLTKDVTFDNQIECDLFEMMYIASKDGILETKELERWCSRNYSKYLALFKRLTDDKLKELKDNGHIYTRTYKEECKYKNVMDDTMYNDATQLYGLKKFLVEFSQIDSKEVMEVKLWDEYLMFAYLFGIADKVAKQLKNIYPEVLQQYNLDYDTILFVNHLSMGSVSAATSARSAAQSYSAGGGGFSSGGGGGGSFGGGGGGSR